MSFFGVGGGNPFSTPVGQRIDKATDVSLTSENWALNLEICDIINETEEGPKDAIKAIKKKLQTGTASKNFSVVMYTLTVLETCVKNCGKRFHICISSKDFLQELIKVIGPKNEPPQVIQEKVLSLIQTWADAFRNTPDLKEIGKFYEDLRKRGIEFPMTDLDSLAPIHTPARVMGSNESPVRSPQTTQSNVPPTSLSTSATYPTQPGLAPVVQTVPNSTMAQQQQQQHRAPAAAAGPVMLNPQQLSKLRGELEYVKGNVKVLGDMLTELQPGSETAADLELMQELHRTCRQMQQRVVELIDKVLNEEVTGELLILNDDLNNVFLRYDRFERNKEQNPNNQNVMSNNAEGPPSYEAAVPNEPQSTGVGNLIDLDSIEVSPQPPPSLQSQLANMSLGNESASVQLSQLNSKVASNGLSSAGTGAAAATATDADEFDMFAQSRQAFDQKTSSTNYTNQTSQLTDHFSGGLGAAVTARAAGQSDKANDYDEMEEWLKKNPAEPKPQENVDSATSLEFDRFLAQRAREGEQLPSSNSELTSNSTNTRQLNKDDKDNAMFAL